MRIHNAFALTVHADVYVRLRILFRNRSSVAHAIASNATSLPFIALPMPKHTRTIAEGPYRVRI